LALLLNRNATSMTDHFKNIYVNKADLYERLVAREDQHGNLFSALNDIRSMYGIDVVEFGAGTGRVTRLLSVMVNYVWACDLAPAMLGEASNYLETTGMENWSLVQADNQYMPIVSNVADVVVEGWSFGHVIGWHPEDWQARTDKMLAEMERIAKPDGTAILIETMGTGQRKPQPPTDDLAQLYEYWQTEHGFGYRWIRTDYQFASIEEADELTRFFFGDELADSVVASGKITLPECTGIWWKQYGE